MRVVSLGVFADGHQGGGIEVRESILPT